MINQPDSKFNQLLLRFEGPLEHKYMLSRLDRDISGFKLMFGTLMFINPLLIFLDIWRYESPYNSITVRFIMELLLIIIFIISHRINHHQKIRYQSLFFLSSITIYLFILASDFLIEEGYYELFVPNVTSILIIINASFIGLRFRHSVFLNLLMIFVFATYANTLSSQHYHKEQLVYLVVFYLVASILSYLFERKNRELFLNQEIIEEKKRIIEIKNFDLKEENRIKDSLITILSHDIKGPLYSLESLLKLKKENLVSAEEIMDHFEKLSHSVRTVRQFTERTILWIKSQMDGFKIKKEFFNVHDRISETIELISGNAQRKGISFDVDIKPDSEVYSDKEMFTIVVRNLISNAIKYSHERAKIRIYEHPTEEIYQISVADSGVGIPLEKLDSLFTLETLSTQGTKREKGTGLGLPLSFNLMVQLGGKLTFDTKEGEGSTFTMKFKKEKA